MVFGKIVAQEKAITSEEEYVYLTKDYRFAVENNYPLKTGYVLEKFYEKKYEEFNFEYYFFNEISSKKTKAILVIAKKEKGENDKLKYLCLPFNNKELSKKTANDWFMGITMNQIFDAINTGLLIKTLELLKNNPTGKIEF